MAPPASAGEARVVVQPKTAEDYRKRAAELRILAKSYPPELHDTLIEVAETYEAVALTVESIAHTTATIGWESWRADGDPKAVATPSSTIFSTRNNVAGFVGDEGRGALCSATAQCRVSIEKLWASLPATARSSMMRRTRSALSDTTVRSQICGARDWVASSRRAISCMAARACCCFCSKNLVGVLKPVQANMRGSEHHPVPLRDLTLSS